MLTAIVLTTSMTLCGLPVQHADSHVISDQSTLHQLYDKVLLEQYRGHAYILPVAKQSGDPESVDVFEFVTFDADMECIKNLADKKAEE